MFYLLKGRERKNIETEKMMRERDKKERGGKSG